MSITLLSLWIALLGATRVDLLLGSGPLVLTPFLILSPLLVLVGFRGLSQTSPRPKLNVGTESFLLALTALVILLTLSAFFAYDLATASRRLALLIAQLGLVTAVGLMLMMREDRAEIVVRGARWGIIGIALGSPPGNQPVGYGITTGPNLTGQRQKEDSRCCGRESRCHIPFLNTENPGSRRCASLFPWATDCIYVISRNALASGSAGVGR